jgi:ribosomal protein S18 acetylase RimI-like enzyme
MIAITDQIVIRQVRHNDLPALEWDGQYKHFRRLFRHAYQRGREGKAVLWIAELPGEGLIGQIFVQLVTHRSELADGNTRAYIYAFRVRPEHRGEGLGTLLLETVEEDLRMRGFKNVCLNVGRDNINARRLYERLGYSVVASEEGIWSYIDHRGRRRQVHEPAWRMEKELK